MVCSRRFDIDCDLFGDDSSYRSGPPSGSPPRRRGWRLGLARGGYSHGPPNGIQATWWGERETRPAQHEKKGGGHFNGLSDRHGVAHEIDIANP
jgi:hypothetical protein